MPDQYQTSKPDAPIDKFTQFYRRYYSDEIGELAQNYPGEIGLYVEYSDIYQYDSKLADDLLSQGDEIREYAEEGLRLYDLPVDVSLGQADFRPLNLPDSQTFDVGDYRTKHIGQLLAIEGEVVACTSVEPYATEAAFACQKCGTLTYLPQSGYELREPSKCQGCEEEDYLSLNQSQSELVDYRSITLQAVDSNLEEPPTLDAHVKKDLVDKVGPGDFVTVVGEYNAKADSDSAILDTYVDVWNIEKDIDGEADKLSASDLREKITEYVEANEGEGEFGVGVEDVKDDIGEEYGVRKQDIETQIENLVEDDSSPIDKVPGSDRLLRQ